MTSPIEPITDPEVDARRKEREEEYGTWVASQPIDLGNARAFNEGDPVPKSTVERLKLDELGLVTKRPTPNAASDEAATGTRKKGGSN